MGTLGKMLQILAECECFFYLLLGVACEPVLPTGRATVSCQSEPKAQIQASDAPSRSDPAAVNCYPGDAGAKNGAYK